MITLASAYELDTIDTGARYLVDRLFPRGVSKASLELAGWIRDAAPSDELRHWFDHDPDRWDEFRTRYFAELDANPESWRPLADAARLADVVLIYAAHDEQHNNAVALREYLLALSK